MVPGSGRAIGGAPERRGVLEGPRGDCVEDGVGDADVGEGQPAAEGAAGIEEVAGLLAEEGDGGGGAGPRGREAGRCRRRGRSAGRRRATGAGRGIHRRDQLGRGPARGRSSPAPKSASTTSAAGGRGGRRGRSDRASGRRRSRRRRAAGPGLRGAPRSPRARRPGAGGRRRSRRRRCCRGRRRRGPGPSGTSAATASATARPAASISVMPGVPAAMVRRSASAISAAVSSSCISGPPAPAGCAGIPRCCRDRRCRRAGRRG